jgi:transposase
MLDWKGKKQQITDRELHELYSTGPETTIFFIKTLFDKLQILDVIVSRQETQIQTLKEQVAKNSRNSSKPPSSDGFNKKPTPKSQRKKSGKRPGGQLGHEGTTLPRSEKPDETVTLSPALCSHCHESLDTSKVVRTVKRQVIDVPKPRIITTEFIAETKECSHCHTLTGADFPPHVAQGIQYGPYLRSLMIYFREQNFIATERLAEVFHDVFGLLISEATFINTTRRCNDLLADFETEVVERLVDADSIHCDETGINVGGKLHWMHSVSNAWLTAYFPHPKRGKAAMDTIGILPRYQGTAIHDGWQSYFNYFCKHALCNSHHLRELTFAEEECGQKWAGKLIALLLEMKKEVETARTLEKEIPEKLKKEYELRYDAIIREGIRKNPIHTGGVRRRGRKKRGKIRCLVDRLKDHKKETLAFFFDVTIPFDNNQAERDIRMNKVQQKVSGGFRSFEAAEAFSRIRGFISTIRKHDLNVMDALVSLFNKRDVLAFLG